MKLLINVVFALLLGSSLSFAQDFNQQKSEVLSKRKAGILNIIDLRIKNMQDFRNCVSSANTGKDVKKCKAKNRKVNEQINSRAEKMSNKASSQNRKVKDLKNNRRD